MDPIQRAIRIVNETDPGWWGELVDSLTKEEVEALRSNTGRYVWVDRDDPVVTPKDGLPPQINDLSGNGRHFMRGGIQEDLETNQ